MKPKAYLDNWRIGVHNEQPSGFGNGPGQPGLSYWPNEGPIQLSWPGNRINAKIHQHGYHEPLFQSDGGPMWTWMALLEKRNDVIPHINNLKISGDMWANAWTPGNSATRAMLALSFTIDGIWRTIEVLVFRANWQGGNPVINSKWHNDSKWSCQLNGAYWGLELTPAIWKTLTVNWPQIINWLIDAGHIPASVMDQPRSNINESLAISHEARSSSASGSGAPVSHMQFRDFTISESN